MNRCGLFLSRLLRRSGVGGNFTRPVAKTVSRARNILHRSQLGNDGEPLLELRLVYNATASSWGKSDPVALSASLRRTFAAKPQIGAHVSYNPV